ncbi:hypothetical protein HU200_005483 [Digitaria exilis]|uniref:Uncharacterized protein n=1 Tax=Digitaria exilis TaxID=1010633 RepID=A0A835FQM7_9POAL|nr:hypothetical protein HU200_005483 [Digitaria exilis]
MELAPWASFLTVVLATVLVTALFLRTRKSYKLPRGPRAWPTKVADKPSAVEPTYGVESRVSAAVPDVCDW